ncbi:hypothetical protein MUCCIDRAFT_115537 [Mucor lusitanicus CBS 277.49]|uniref:Uncharacterized protein n=1 Tax=Mucor lusitanicus CBS 277.49 TaxID=747725 RepID=A0A168HC61_MUCCL|nr:hypothetical protein MUCCIDRAFT_115537 [Mucor lusitanicus CBS 277.49]
MNLTASYTELAQLKVEALIPPLVAMLLCVGLTASNHPQGVPVIMNHYLGQIDSMEEQIKWIEYTRNAMFKSVVLCGGPRVINAEIALYDHLSIQYQSLLGTTALNANGNTALWNTRGMDFFKQIYGAESASKQKMIQDANPDLWYYVNEVYGNIVSDMTHVSAVDTELQVIVSLIQMDALPQDHVLGAERVGATREQIKAAEFIGYKVKHLLE